MCGILIHLNINGRCLDYNSFYEELFYMRRKGDEGVGVGIIKYDGSFTVIKNTEYAEDMTDFIVNNHSKLKPHFEDINTWAIVAHGRKPSTGLGKVGPQPFFSDRFMLVHNGHVPFIYNFLPESENYEYLCDSDSERMLSYLYDREHNENYNVEHFYDLIWNRIGTIGVVVTYDKLQKCLYFYRDMERDLIFQIDDNRRIRKACNLIECAETFFGNDITLDDFYGNYRYVRKYEVMPGIYKIGMNNIPSKIYGFNKKECKQKKDLRYKLIKRFRDDLRTTVLQEAYF